MTGHTSPDNLPFPDDYSAPADSPNSFEELAEATQAALTNRLTPTTGQLAVSAVHSGPSGAGPGDQWDTYHAITAAGTWQGIGAWLEFLEVPRAGTWDVSAFGYIDATGGTSSGVAVFLGCMSTWADGTAPSVGSPSVGRLTVPATTRIVIGTSARQQIANDPARRLRLRACGQLSAAVAGAVAQIGLIRVSATFMPAPAALPVTGYSPS